MHRVAIRGALAAVATLAVFMVMVIMAAPGHARMKQDAAIDRNPLDAVAKTATIPNTQNRSHRVGNVWMTITNYGFFGSQFRQSQLVELEGPFAGMPAPSFEFPAGSGVNYLFQGALWFGAIVGIDTLVSVGADGWQRVNETFPDEGAAGAIIEMSNRQSSPNFSEEAVSEQDYVAVYYDTLTDQTYVAPDPDAGRPHRPIGLKIMQKSYSWSYDYAQDFILIDFILHNISDQVIEKPYMALYVDADCWHEATPGSGFADDYSGYLEVVPSPHPGLWDTINIAWTADNDGDPISGGIFNYMSPTGISGTRVVRGPSEPGGCGPAPLNYSFNWWTSNGDTRFDWGPRKESNYRDFGTGGDGTPAGDLNKYYIMSNGEFDYGQLFSAIDFSDSTDWRAPKQPGLARDIADGYDTRYLFSFGPLADMAPGESTYVTVGYVGGEGFHVNGDDFATFFNPDDPAVFYEKLDFSDFAANAQWAAWVFDNPGVDTDSSGCFGLFYEVDCKDTIDTDGVITYADCDTVFYAGDGVPDFKGPPPPPAPDLSITAGPGRLRIRWTGEVTELAPDDFTLRRDFEGFRLYVADFNTLVSYALVASWDRIDFRRFDYNQSSGRWVQNNDPILLDTLRVMYGENFDPTLYGSSESPFTDQFDSLFYFEAQDWNQGNISRIVGTDTVFNEIQRIGEGTVFNDRTGLDDTYGIYEMVLENLLPSQPYYIAVTAFDFGNREMLGPLESSPLVNATLAFPTNSADRVAEENLQVMVYPNPYKVSDDYRGRVYEDRDRSGWSERSRRIHFVNLPERAKITIFTIDGDIVREFYHEPGGIFTETSSTAWWDLISRNTQAIVSGIYLYTVESETRTQMGKIVLIK